MPTLIMMTNPNPDLDPGITLNLKPGLNPGLKPGLSNSPLQLSGPEQNRNNIGQGKTTN